MSHRLKFILSAITIFVATVALIIGGYSWFLTKMARVESGTAHSTFPYNDYSLAELNKMYPQTLNENVITTQTPEQTFNKFITAVKANDFSTAAKCCFQEAKQANIENGLKKLQDTGKLSEMLKDLGGGIKPNSVGDTKASYDYSYQKDGKSWAGNISFIKNSQGVWLIESL